MQVFMAEIGEESSSDVKGRYRKRKGREKGPTLGQIIFGKILKKNQKIKKIKNKNKIKIKKSKQKNKKIKKFKIQKIQKIQKKIKSKNQKSNLAVGQSH